MDNYSLFEKLLHSESEDDVEAVLKSFGLFTDDETIWRPLGFENNFAAIGNQQSDPTAAMIEKIVNSIDAVLMRECFAKGIDPKSDDAPKTMVQAVEQFFDAPDGRIDNLPTPKQRQLANMINLVAVGDKKNPSYLIIDHGEGQTPAKFPETFLSLMHTNKINIPFVQGKFNSGGTGVLQFCGEKNRNYQLIVSRRHPECPIDENDTTADLWGFTLVRRLLPTAASRRRSSMYVYLAPDGNVLSFAADGIPVLPVKSKANQPDMAYADNLPYGTCIKLYNYRWRAKSTATVEARYEIEQYLHSACLPFRITETRRGFHANYYSTTVIGGWISAIAADDDGEVKKLEPGFPAYGEIDLPGIGQLPYQIAVFKLERETRRVPLGVYFVINGQVHGALPSNFVTNRLKLDYLKNSLLVSVDCTDMDIGVREDFFMASRDRVRKNEAYNTIEEALTKNLGDHPGLQDINQRRRKEKMEADLNSERHPLEAFQQLLDADPTISNLFGGGGRLVTGTGPSKIPVEFQGKQFPTFFRLSNEPKGGMVKPCPINRTALIEFETDAENEYFKRFVNPGTITIDPPDLLEHQRLWNGHFQTRFRVPWDAKPGDKIAVTVTVTDIQRETLSSPFVLTFVLKAEEEVDDDVRPGLPPSPPAPKPIDKNRRVVLDIPKIKEIRKDQWELENPAFDAYEAVRINNSPAGGYDFLVNVDNVFLLTELARAKEDDKLLIKYWFKYGLVLAAVGMIKHSETLKDTESLSHRSNGYAGKAETESVDLDSISLYCNGLARVIVPIVKTLSRVPAA